MKVPVISQTSGIFGLALGQLEDNIQTQSHAVFTHDGAVSAQVASWTRGRVTSRSRQQGQIADSGVEISSVDKQTNIRLYTMACLSRPQELDAMLVRI